jgi:hydrogenase large subunit
MEVGPLARMLISGNYSGGHSCLDRIYARTLEAEKILTIMDGLNDRIELLPNNQRPYAIPVASQGTGLIDTTRGALGHFISIKDKVIEHYEVLTPSNWNLSPKDSDGQPGTIEKALIGTVIGDPQSPVEIGRIIRSFDPCVSCATHLSGKNGYRTRIDLPV